MSRRTRVVFFLPNLGAGGAERVAVNIMRMLPDVDRHLVLMEPRIEYDHPATLHVLSGNPAGAGPLARRSVAMARNLVQLRGLKRELGAATWLSFTSWANVLNVATGGRGRIVLSSHSRESVNIRGRTAPLLRGLVRRTYPKADLVVSVSESVKQDLVTAFGIPPARIRTIYNSVDLEAAHALAQEALPREEAALFDEPTVLAAGTLGEPKGHWHLLRAFARLRELSGQRLRLIFLGTGPLRDYLANLSRELGLATWAAWERSAPGAVGDADVAFLGFRRNPFAYFARATVFAFPSIWEGFGNVLIEAMASGAPVVASDCRSGPREILAPESPVERRLIAPEHASAGILMPALDGRKREASSPLTKEEMLWAEVLAQIAGDAAARDAMRAAGRARAAAFSTDALAPAWREVLLDS